jgi:hypothetical protein
LPRFDLLKVPSGYFGSFSQRLLREAPAHALASHVGSKHFDPCPFFPGNGHGILHRFAFGLVNDTYIVKKHLRPVPEKPKMGNDT